MEVFRAKVWNVLSYERGVVTEARIATHVRKVVRRNVRVARRVGWLVARAGLRRYFQFRDLRATVAQVTRRLKL